MNSAILDLIVASRQEANGYAKREHGFKKWNDLADAAEKELERREILFEELCTELDRVTSKLEAQPRIDLEALRKYLGHSKEGWRQMMAQLEGAKGKPGPAMCKHGWFVCHEPECAPKPEAQTCTECKGAGGFLAGDRVDPLRCPDCNGTGKVGGGR